MPFEPLDPEETPKGVALAALKEIEFDRETGKLSDEDYEFLKAKYTMAAVEALRGEQVASVSNDIEALIAARVRSLRSARNAGRAVGIAIVVVPVSCRRADTASPAAGRWRHRATRGL